VTGGDMWRLTFLISELWMKIGLEIHHLIPLKHDKDEFSWMLKVPPRFQGRSACKGGVPNSKTAMVRVSAGGIGFQNQTPMGLSETQHGSCDPRIVAFDKSPAWNTSQNVGQRPKKPSTNIDNIYLISIPKLCSTVTSPEFIFGVSQMQTTGPAKVHQMMGF